MKALTRKTVLLMLAMLFVLSGLALDRLQAAENMDTTVKIAEMEGVGKYLTDQKGITLYYFTKDSPNKSACSGFCLERWPIFYVESLSVPKGLDASDFGVITRDDGNKQTTYKGRPLYYFLADYNPGDIKGQGVYDSWYVVAP